MADIQSATAETRRGKEERKKKIEETIGKNITACPIPNGGYNNEQYTQ